MNQKAPIDTAPARYIKKTVAARLCGISTRTVCRWIERSKNGEIRHEYVGPKIGEAVLYVNEADIKAYARMKRPTAPLPR